MSKVLLLAKNLHRLMSDARLSASELGRRLKIPAATVKKLRTGENINPTISTLLPIANYFGVTISQLIGDQPLSKPALDIASSYGGQELALLPLISWEQSILWNIDQNINAQTQILAEQKPSENSFALLIETSDSPMFEEGGVILVDKNKEYNHGDYILIHKSGQSRPSIKKILIEDGVKYMQSILMGLNVSYPLDSSYKVLGTVISYKRWFN